mmetsp:Transcript_21047/g.34817  ORF Transcript_21047/g.34817 Transcript_21047/m.34817 type:complete len:334 (+) Transcript_21047:115-1116(+)|eukprot:CAMPEP_0119013900 /NCGR_PEP_ID=MMETSP1176-20130426/9202_1 /TAXON_ID=265551 /ORGANISM="Synedropsis recta cf, Strain CCMP1620" /LENGTH=333 /DNA_ID=CAMNT_0006967027 /DNA_START=56 /DNA_END=1057 /DNA_ORIENTATION=+
MNLTLLNYLNVVCFIANLVVTYGVGVLGIGGLATNTELSEKYQTLVTPVGFAFAIWGLIFIAQFIFAIVQLLPSFRGAPLVAKAIGYDYVGVCLSQIAWTLAFTFEVIWLSFLAMLSILYFLLSTVNDQYKLQDTTTFRDYWLLKFPFSIHCGWIIAASFVNLSVFLVDLGVSPSAQYFVALGTLVSLLVVACFSVSFPNRPEYVIPAVLAWASFGIYMELDDPKELIATNFTENRIGLVRNGSLITACVIVVAIVVKFILNAVKKSDDGGNADGYTRYDDSHSRASQSRASQSRASQSKASKRTAKSKESTDDTKSYAPSMTSGLSEGLSEV